jgi:hypothetical protein
MFIHKRRNGEKETRSVSFVFDVLLWNELISSIWKLRLYIKAQILINTGTWPNQN